MLVYNQIREVKLPKRFHLNGLTKSKVRDTQQDYIIHSGSEGVKINVWEIWAKSKTN